MTARLRCLPRRIAGVALLLALCGPEAALAQQGYLQPPAQPGPEARCDYFARLHRFSVQSKSMCDEGRKVKPGPLTLGILERCRAEQGARFDRLSADDLMAAFLKQVDAQGLGNACHAIKLQVWDLIQQ